MSLAIPIRFSDGAGNAPAAANWNDCNDWLTALAMSQALILNGGMEAWGSGTSFTNPATGSTLADYWNEIKTGTSACTANVTREASVVDTGSYSMKVNITGAGSSDSYWAIKQSAGNPSNYSGLTTLFSARVKCATASKVRVKIYDGTTTTYSAYHTGDGTWQLLQVKSTMASIPSEVTVTVEINPANFTDAIYVDSCAVYLVPSAISARAQQALIFNPVAVPSQLFIGFQAPVIFSTVSDTTEQVGTWTATALQASITLTNAAHRVLIFGNAKVRHNAPNGGTMIALYKDGATIDDATNGQGTYISATASASMVAAILGVDTPGDTSSHTYRVYMKNSIASGTAHCVDSATARMILMEIV